MANNRRSMPKTQNSASAVAKTRVGMRVITVFVEPATFRRFKMLAIKEDKTVQDLGREAIKQIIAMRR